MKRKLPSPSTAFARPLKPKIPISMQILPVESMSVYNSNNGNTYLSIHPYQIVIDSRDLISLIENKKECLMVDDYSSIQIHDILNAIHDISVLHSNQNFLETKPAQNCLSTSDPKRPTNAFILFNNTFRKRVKFLFPNYSNSEISKFIGAMWKAVAKEIKEDYINQAIECRRLHKMRYPNFEYKLSRTNAQQDFANPQDSLSTDWENYFNFCIQNASTEAANGTLHCDSFSQLQFANYGASYNFGQDIRNLNTVEQSDMGEWGDVYNVISQFFPDESDQANYIDEQLWDILNNFLTPTTIDSDLLSL